MTNLPQSLHGISFFKMTGSGNDFVFFDGRFVDAGLVTQPQVIRAICDRYNGIGADGVVVLEPAGGEADVRILYYNSDGSAADLCGNATLCSTTLSAVAGFVRGSDVHLATPAGVIEGRNGQGDPSIRLAEASLAPLLSEIPLEDGELRIGFARAGIPHLVVLVDAVDTVDLEARGPVLRWHPATGPAGANVNWVSRMPDGTWRYRTYERGVEGETLACGTGAVATAVQLVAWGEASSPVTIRSSSGKDLVVTLESSGPGSWRPTLQGEGRIVYRGTIE
jgi:diaminopimelate epimerase